jgi:putative membrane-bound dehydrogenase-like protein
MKKNFLYCLLFLTSLNPLSIAQSNKTKSSPLKITSLFITQDAKTSSISIFRKNGKSPILTQVAKDNFRPFLHPIVAPDGNGILTEYSPGHHKHQTGIYWGYTRVNGRDYFHHPDGDYWRKSKASVIKNSGNEVKWETVYDLLDEKGNAVLTETQTWSMREENGKYLLKLIWTGEAKTDVTIGMYDYGGLFVRMPWKEGIDGEVNNGARQKNEKAEGQRSNWVDVGIKIEGRKDRAHIAVFDHPENNGFPQHWRVDNQLGIGVARARKGNWEIKKGKIETIKHEILVYTGNLKETEINKLWASYSGQDMSFNVGGGSTALWGVAQQEGRDAKFLNPAEATAAMTLKPGFKVNAWAAEPMITQPMAFCWDDKGRLWIAENRDYESRGYGFSKAGNSRILIIEDTNHDGIADSKKVFLEGIAFPSAIAVGFDGLYLGAPPNLLFVPDKNHDDVADMADIEVKLTGWGIRDRHETLNSLHWGPDGWLYGLQGFATPSKVRKPNGKGKIYKQNDPFPEDILQGEGVDINGGVWRYHPTKDIFEVVAHGFSNPWGIDHDAKGQLFISACVIPHMWHVVPGGVYHRQGGQHFNPYLYSDIRTIADHTHRSAHGGARVYQSDAFPADQKGKIFMANIHEHAILSDVLAKSGSGFVAKHGDELLLANNAQWVGFSMEVGPDGGLYVLDWHDADICGKEVLNGETGRVYRVMPTENLAENWAGRFDDLNALSDLKLASFQTNSSDWHSRRARVILQNRSSKGKIDQNAISELQNILKTSSNADYRLRAMWSLHVTHSFAAGQLESLLSDSDEYIRSWAIQLLCEDKSPSADALVAFTNMAKEDKSAVVRLYLASALQRIPEASAWKIASELTQHAEDSEDHNLPKMIWFGLEPLVKAKPKSGLELLKNCQVPMIANYIARRLVDANEHELLISYIGIINKNLTHVLEGMKDGLEGRFDLNAPKNWNAVFKKLTLKKGVVATLATQISQRFGETDATQKYIALLKNNKSSIDQRKEAINYLAAGKKVELKNEIPNLFNQIPLRMDVISAIANFNEDNLGALIVSNYKVLSVVEKRRAIETLSSRPKYGWQLTQALKNQTIPKSDIPAYTARQLLRVVGSGFIEYWGPIEQEQSLEKAYIKYRNILTPAAILEANAKKGEIVFQKSCGSCHKMYGNGGNIGPELTGSNRANLDYFLFNVLNPSGEIQEDYKLVVITTRDGRTYSGNVIAENDRQVTMRIVGKESSKINKSEIQSREVMPSSLMPVGILETIQENEVLDLVKYMQTMKPKS